MTLRTVVVGLLTAASLSSCSTVSTLSSGIREPWSGSKLDMYIMNSPHSSLLRTGGAVLDYPLSLAGDAFVLAFLQPGSAEAFRGPEHP